jgi:hypothetical protein
LSVALIELLTERLAKVRPIEFPQVCDERSGFISGISRATPSANQISGVKANEQNIIQQEHYVHNFNAVFA